MGMSMATVPSLSQEWETNSKLKCLAQLWDESKPEMQLDWDKTGTHGLEYKKQSVYTKHLTLF